MERVSRRERLRRDLLAGRIPTEATISDVQSLFEEAGWVLDRIAGSHYQFTKENQRTAPVPVHNQRVGFLSLRTLAKVLREASND